MIDILIDDICNTDKAKNLMQMLFNLDANKVYSCYYTELDQVIVPNDISCLCVVSDVYGDVKTLLSLYIISMDFTLFMQKLINLSRLCEHTFFIPIDEYNGFFKVHHQRVEKVMLDEKHAKDDCVYFINTVKPF